MLDVNRSTPTNRRHSETTHPIFLGFVKIPYPVELNGQDFIVVDFCIVKAIVPKCSRLMISHLLLNAVSANILGSTYVFTILRFNIQPKFP